MDKETILDYATETPGNTNRNVLGSMLNQFAKNNGGSGGGHFRVTISQPTTGEEEPWVSDKTFGEILEAYESGMVLDVSVETPENGAINGFLSPYYSDGSIQYFEMSMIVIFSDGDLREIFVEISNDGGQTAVYFQCSILLKIVYISFEESGGVISNVQIGDEIGFETLNGWIESDIDLSIKGVKRIGSSASQPVFATKTVWISESVIYISAIGAADGKLYQLQINSDGTSSGTAATIQTA